MKPKYLVLVISIYVFVACNLFSLIYFKRMPRINDEAAYNFQAKIFLSGHLYAPAPCAPEFFSFPHVIINKGKWYSQYPPGFPALLTIGHIFRAPWIINPFLAALSIVLIYRLGKGLFDSNIGIMSAVLCSLSYWFIIMSSTMMSHTSSLFFNLLFLYYFFKIIEKPAFSRGLLAGAAFGFAFLIRLYNALLFVLPLFLIIIIYFIREPKKYISSIFGFFINFILAFSIFLIYNWGTTGNPFKFGYIEKYGKSVLPGLGERGLYSESYTLFLAQENLKENILAINRHLFGWPVSSLWGVILFLFFYFNKKFNANSRKKELFLFLPVISYLIGLPLYWGSFAFLGARMYFELVPILVLLSGYGLFHLGAYLNKRSHSKLISRRFLFIILALFFCFSYFSMFRNLIHSNDYDSLWGAISPHFSKATFKVKTLIDNLDIQKAVILLKPVYIPARYFPDSDWSSGFINNDPFLKNSVIFARAAKNDLSRIFDCHRSRKIFLLIYTLEKGMLLEVKKANGHIYFASPLSLPFKKEYSALDLIIKASQFFFPYNDSFSSFLEELNKIPPFEFDLSTLFSKAHEEERRQNYEKAAHFYEACLQIEINPEARLNIAQRLISCYVKLKDKKSLESILPKIYNAPNPILYNLFPEKGF